MRVLCVSVRGMEDAVCCSKNKVTTRSPEVFFNDIHGNTAAEPNMARTTQVRLLPVLVDSWRFHHL